MFASGGSLPFCLLLQQIVCVSKTMITVHYICTKVFEENLRYSWNEIDYNYFMFGWLCISNYICTINQHDALFFHFTTPLHALGPFVALHQEAECIIWRMVLVLLLKRMSACLTPADNHHIIHSASWWWAINGPEICRLKELCIVLV
jgi:hypothetical protein